MPRPRNEQAAPRLVRIEGRRPYYIRWSDPGTRRSRVVSTRTSVEEEAQRVLADFINQRPANPTVTQLLDAYLENRKGKVLAYSRIMEASRPLKRILGHLYPEQVRDYTRPVANETLRREIRTFRAAMNLAVRRRWIEEAPSVEMPPPSPPRERYMSREQARTLMGCATVPHLRLFMALGFATGARKTAILRLTWDRVDFRRKWLDFNEPDRPVSDKKRPSVPVGDGVMAMLKEAEKLAQSDYVIEYNGVSVKSVKRSWNLAAERAGVGWATAHHMKHSVISWLAEDGFPVDTIADLTATSERTVRRIYRKYSPNYLADAAAALDISANSVGTNEVVEINGK